MKNLSTLLLLAIAASFGCADGCGCGGSPEAPVVPESAGAASEFDPATSGSVNSAPANAAEVARPEAESAPPDETSEVALNAPTEGSGDEVVRPHQLDPAQRLQMANPPTIRLQPITPGQGGRMPNRVAPHITSPQVRQAGPTSGSVDPDFIVNE